MSRLLTPSSSASCEATLRSDSCYDEHGALRVWKPQDDMDGAFKGARDQVCIPIIVVGTIADQPQQTLELLQLYSKISPVDGSRVSILLPDAVVLSLPDEELDFNATLIILTEKKKLHLTAQFRRDAHVYYFDAKHSAVASIVTILVCVYGGLVVLSFRAARRCLGSSLALTAKLRHDASAYCVEVKRSTLASITTNRLRMELTAKFRHSADACYIAVKRGIVAIPVWLYVVLLLLLLLWWGQWSDKAVAVLFNRPSWLSFQTIWPE
ncbi:hypothetical protein FIBSPDRAFT_57493 [Athelia psychrophila]|uniref:Sey1/RHD3-like three-helix bundle domain-containing protein n=1 Tax=Athelia psychrophila TaxID=1759441 RepID=A0A166FC46_9AGAM|nr:hypothetical protein FIBSPDRAFT_57493 [Fibularhizoctonia sp. CBS 109695]